MAHLRLRFADVLKLGQIDSESVIRNFDERLSIAVCVKVTVVRVEHEKLVPVTSVNFFAFLRRQDLVPVPSRHTKDGMPYTLLRCVPLFIFTLPSFLSWRNC